MAEREGKLVLTDLWATWCKNCVVMDETTLVDPAVQARLADYVKIKHQAEFPDDLPDNLLMKRIGAIGLPEYAIYRPKGIEPSGPEGGIAVAADLGSQPFDRGGHSGRPSAWIRSRRLVGASSRRTRSTSHGSARINAPSASK